jgi:acyl-coenzyme A synthetase/AMP-(fatty) acid ligase
VEVEEYSLPQQAERYGATMMQCTPSMMSMLHLNPEAMRALQPLRTLMLGGEALPPKLAMQVKETLPAQLINMYGPTETTIWSATHKVETGGAVSIGRPIANTQIYILDHYGQPVPLGVAGELCIGGDGVARGYYNRAELCAERFVPDSFGSVPGARLYRTGDLARLSPEGICEFLGRLDFQVKIRGHRIELQEIEARIGQYPAVREVVVLAREDVPGDKRLVADVMWSKAESTDPQALRDYLKDRLPDYMIPAVFMTIESFPQTSNGKVNRKALPAPDGRRGALKGDYAAPRSKMEQSIAAIWREVLKVDRVGLHDNFFDIGGHSLLMAQVHSQLRELFKRDMPLIKMFEHPTISSLALFLSREQNEQNTFKQSYDRALKQREGLKRQKQPAKAKYKGQ